MNDAERCLGELLSRCEAPAFDMAQFAPALQTLAASLSALSPETPRVELERILALHAALRTLVERRYLDVGRSLDAVVHARARCSRLTRPHDARTVVDMDA